MNAHETDRPAWLRDALHSLEWCWCLSAPPRLRERAAELLRAIEMDTPPPLAIVQSLRNVTMGWGDGRDGIVVEVTAYGVRGWLMADYAVTCPRRINVDWLRTELVGLASVIALRAKEGGCDERR